MDIIANNKSICCKNCNYEQTLNNYKKKYRIAKESVKYGFQYRKRYEYDLKKKPSPSLHYILKELHDIFNFLGLAVISGLAGNFAYDKLKIALNRVIRNPLTIEITDKDFQRFLKSEAQQKKFIKYIEEYRKNKIEGITSPKKKVKKAKKQKLNKNAPINRAKKRS